MPIVQGGTGSSSQNFVDLSTNQTSIGGNKVFDGLVQISTADPSNPSLLVQNTDSRGFAVVGVNSAAAGSNGGFGVVGGTSQNGGAGVYAYNVSVSGTGLVAAGNNVGARPLLLTGSGLAATGLTTGVYAVTTSAGPSQAIFTDNFGNLVYVNYWDGTTQYKIRGGGVVSTLVKATEVDTETHTMFAPEAPEVLFED
jgi:hypothetical protein